MENIDSLLQIDNNNFKNIIKAFVEQFYLVNEQNSELKDLLNKYMFYKDAMKYDERIKFHDLFISTSQKDISCLKNELLFEDCFKLIIITLQHGYYPYTYLYFYDQLSLIKTLNQTGRLPSAPILLPNLFDEFYSNIITVFVLYESERISLNQKELSEKEKQDRNKSIKKQIYNKISTYKNLNISAKVYKYFSIINKLLIDGYCNALNKFEKEELLDLYMLLTGIKNKNVNNMSRAQGLFIWDNQYISNEYKNRAEAIRELNKQLFKLKIKSHNDRFFEDKYTCTNHCIEMRQVLSISGANKKKFLGYKMFKRLEHFLIQDRISYNEYWDMKEL